MIKKKIVIFFVCMLLITVTINILNRRESNVVADFGESENENNIGLDYSFYWDVIKYYSNLTLSH